MRENKPKCNLFPAVLKVLGVNDYEVMEFSPEYYENYGIMANDAVDLQWLYTTLSDKNRKAIEYLVAALYMAEHSPEVFTDNNLCI